MVSKSKAQKPARKTAKAAEKPKEQKASAEKASREVEVGKVTHYYANIGVAVIELSKAIKIGDTIRVKGHTTDFQQKISSMQSEHEKITAAQPGQSIGLKVQEPVRQNDVVYKVG